MKSFRLADSESESDSDDGLGIEHQLVTRDKLSWHVPVSITIYADSTKTHYLKVAGM